MEVRTPYNYDRDEVSKNTALVCEDESLTQQNMKAETDINVMIRKYGVLPAQQINWKEFDATVIPKDYHDLQNMMKEADEAFLSLPGEVRAQADNDPVKFLALVDAQKAAIRKQEKESAKADKGSVDPALAVDADKAPE
ncbi:internal scaffolding protein [Microviridae sp.]|nr:internal scaffolding protein [Microviridae sp.]